MGKWDRVCLLSVRWLERRQETHIGGLVSRTYLQNSLKFTFNYFPLSFFFFLDLTFDAKQIQYGTVVKSTALKSGKTGSDPWIWSSPAAWAIYLSSLGLSFPICEMGM